MGIGQKRVVNKILELSLKDWGRPRQGLLEEGRSRYSATVAMDGDTISSNSPMRNLPKAARIG